MVRTHIVTSYDNDLQQIQEDLIQMGEKVIEQTMKALEALNNRDASMAQKVMEEDKKLDEIEQRLDAFTIRMIALRQPVAQDLRAIVTALKISSHLERMGDYAVNIARRALSLCANSTTMPTFALEQMLTCIKPMIQDVLQSYVHGDPDLAIDVWHRDDAVNKIYGSYLRELLTHMMEDPRHITPCTELLFAAKNMERMGDHVTNIAEMVYYFVHGSSFVDPQKPS